MKKFRTWYDQIEEVEAISETTHYLTIQEGNWRPSRVLKRSDSRNYFDSWVEAHQFLIDREKTAIVDLLAEVGRHQKTLDKLQEMSQP